MLCIGWDFSFCIYNGALRNVSFRIAVVPKRSKGVAYLNDAGSQDQLAELHQEHPYASPLALRLQRLGSACWNDPGESSAYRGAIYRSRTLNKSRNARGMAALYRPFLLLRLTTHIQSRLPVWMDFSKRALLDGLREFKSLKLALAIKSLAPSVSAGVTSTLFHQQPATWPQYFCLSCMQLAAQ